MKLLIVDPLNQGACEIMELYVYNMFVGGRPLFATLSILPPDLNGQSGKKYP